MRKDALTPISIDYKGDLLWYVCGRRAAQSTYAFGGQSKNFQQQRNFMKNRLFLGLGLTVILTSCSAGPESVAKDFTENLAKGKIEEAKKDATESTGKLIDMASSLGSLHVNPNFTFKMDRDSVVDNMAWVTYINDKGRKEKIQLVKIDGKWLVNINSKK
jgi:hypothetical protein